MLATEQVEELICLLASWDRQTLVNQFVTFRSSFPVDLTSDFFADLTEEQIRHVFLALCLQNQRLPELDMVVV